MLCSALFCYISLEPSWKIHNKKNKQKLIKMSRNFNPKQGKHQITISTFQISSTVYFFIFHVVSEWSRLPEKPGRVGGTEIKDLWL